MEADDQLSFCCPDDKHVIHCALAQNFAAVKRRRADLLDYCVCYLDLPLNGHWNEIIPDVCSVVITLGATKPKRNTELVDEIIVRELIDVSRSNF